MDKDLIGKDERFKAGCISCHKGNDKAPGWEDVHKGMVVKPSGPGHQPR